MKILESITIKLTSIAIVVVSPFFLMRCVVDTFDMKLKIVNRTSETIFVDLSKTNKPFKSHPVQIDSIKKDTLWNYMRWIPPLDSLDNQPPFGSWEGYINKKCEDSTLTIFIFDKRLLKTMSRDSLVANQLYSKKFAYKVKDLEKLNWRVEYK